MSEKRNAKGEKALKGGWVVKNLIAAVLVVLAIVLLSAFFLNVVTQHGKVMEVPDLTGMNLSEAKYEAGVRGLRVEVTDSVYIRRMGRGLVYGQNPKPGASVKKGRRILLTINSVNPKKVTMPNLVGYSMRQAKAELLSRGLALGRLDYQDDMATNNVLRQMMGGTQVLPGKMIDSGSEVDLVVGLNPEDNQTYVPDVRGMKFSRAVDAIHDNSLNIKALKFDESIRSYTDSLDAIVTSQSPSASRESVLMGTEVTLWLSPEVAR